MKKLLALIPLLCFALGASAQFEPMNSGQDRTIVFFDLKVNGSVVDGDMLSNSYQVGAFIDGVCRATSTFDFSTQNPYPYFEVWGNGDPENPDTGKEITFKVYDIASGYTYNLTSSQTVTFNSEVTYGQPSSGHVVLSVTMPASIDETSFSLADINISVGTTVNLKDYLTITPAGAQLPEGYSWSVGNYATLATISGDNLTAVAATPHTIDYSLILPGVNNPTGAPGDDIIINGNLTINNPATAINIKTNCSTFEVNVGQSDALMEFLDNAYELVPAGSTDVVTWQVGDATIIAPQTDATTAAVTYNPIKRGVTTMTPVILNGDGTVRLSGDPITITVIQPVTEFNAKVTTITSNVGDTDIKARLEALLFIGPENANDQSLNWTITSNREDAITENATDGSYTAAKMGTAYIRVSPNSNQNLFVDFTVIVEDPATTATFTANPLDIEITTNDGTDVTEQILGNITLNGTSPKNATITLTQVSPEGAITGESSITDNGANPDKKFMAFKAGTATVKVSLSWQNYSTGQTTVKNFSFKVNINENIPIESFDIAITPDATLKNFGTITLTPVPANATFDASKLSIVGESEIFDEWEAIGIAQDDTNPLVFTYAGIMPGVCNLTVMLNGARVTTSDENPSVNIPYVVNLEQGWQWKSNAWGYASSVDDFSNLFGGTNLAEARTQSALLFDDTNWGYVGTMTNPDMGGGISQAAMYKVKMDESTTSYLYNGTSPAKFGETTLRPGWTWVGSPFFYNRLLGNAINMGNNTSAIVIVGKTGSAEWSNGQWNGDLKTINTREGYLFYNPGTQNVSVMFNNEIYNMEEGNEEASSSRSDRHSVWSYDPSRFANNMTMVATLDGIDNIDGYSLGAFVDGECRGEGVAIDGKMYVTVHADNGEVVSFRLYNEFTGQYCDVDQTVSVRQRVGSVAAPFKMTSQAIALGVGSVSTNNGNAVKAYDLQGRQVNRQSAGQHTHINIVRMSDGTVRKVVK